MKRKMINTSLQAYQEVKPKISKKQKEVLEAMAELKEATNQELANKLSWPLHTVTPRTFELLRAKKLIRTKQTDRAWKMKISKRKPRKSVYKDGVL